MRPTTNQVLPVVSAVGKLGAACTFPPIPAGNVLVKLVRAVGDAVEYVEPPQGVGQGFKGLKWERDPHEGQAAFTLKAATADLAAALPLAQWRAAVAADFPDRTALQRRSAGARRLAEFARGLLTVTAALHRARWRLGLVEPDNLYLLERETTDVFLPDLGFAWVGTISLAKPNWLRAEDHDRDLWAEERATRQYAAPIHYQKYLPSVPWDQLVQRDLRLVARLLRFVLTGSVGGTEPANASRCPVWRVIRDAEAGRFVDTDKGFAAENMLSALLAGMKAPPEPATGDDHKKKPHRGQWVPALLLVLLLGAGAVGIWYFLNRPGDGNATPNSEMAKGSNGTTGKTSPTGRAVPPDTSRVPPKVDDLADRVTKAPNVIAKGRAAVDLGKVDPRHPLVAQTRAELWAAYKEAYRKAQGGEHLPLRTQEILGLFKQLPESP